LAIRDERLLLHRVFAGCGGRGPLRLASRRARKYSVPIGMTEITLIARMM